MKKLLWSRWRPLAFLLTALLGAGLASCETDLDPNDSYRETTVIYAALDAGQSRQYIRINKAFLNTKTNALTIAGSRPDSITYPENAIEASLEWLRPGPDSSLINTYRLERTVLTTKDPGTFYGPDQVIYQTPANMPPISPANLYRVRVLNKRTGQITTGATSVPDPNLINFTLAGNQAINPSIRGWDTIRYDFEPHQKTGIGFRTQPNAGIYTAQVDFNFVETTSNGTVNRTLTWDLFGNVAVEQGRNQEYALRNITEFAFFDQFLVNKLDVRNDPSDMIRRPGLIYYRVTAGSPEWARYQEVIRSASAILQTTPEYTNVRNGRGLVVGRASRAITLWISPRSQNYSGTKAAFGRYPQFKFDLP